MKYKVIGTDPDGLSHAVGEGIFGYGTPNGSLGHSAFLAPKVFGGRVRQGVFWTPYSYQGYEVEQPEQQWAVLNRPGVPPFPGSSARGPVLIGPAMGAMSTGAGIALIVGVVGAAAAATFGLAWLMSRG
jgi:hypothetical protein